MIVQATLAFFLHKNQENEKNHLIQLSEKLNFPILADSLSGMRFGFNSTNILAHYNFYLNNISIPNLIIRFGKKPNSKKLNEFLDIHRITTLIM